ncbi:hypothetical protein SLITO_v1c06780 [Spiroplasma litorale]|uniref:Uncharacterized protein n=1 Tax=Spiroplasma litorale TaxID=216942 RepID=A0A0K1W1W5_9MOLU|nr:hypothetical protein [Spiroplasma litorale]AKX34305.1 hypothetical protein SLITO_v1c06780 [Spiroplasma litorale]
MKILNNLKNIYINESESFSYKIISKYILDNLKNIDKFDINLIAKKTST